MPTTVQIDPSFKHGCDPALLQALASPETYPGHPRVAVHETHASWVFVAGDRAFKIKKPLALGFLDYSTLALRHRACREEVRVNRELADGIYVGVRAIVRSATGFRFTSAPDPSAVEYAVEMRSFSEQDTLAGLITAGSLTPAHVQAVARLLADFHRNAAVAAGWGPDRVLALWRQNVRELRLAGPPTEWRLDIPEQFGDAFVEAHSLELRERALLGLARDGHGDLRCEHVLARPTVRVVDRVEFDPELRRTDIACDLAFLAMDLEANGQRWASLLLSAAYRDGGMSRGSDALRSFYAAHWALVRTKVTLIAAAEHDRDARAERLRDADQLWALSERLCWRARAPLALIICGPAASGKSVLARELSRRSELPVVSSDAVRKRLAHLSPLQAARPEHYSAHFTVATYEQLSRDALLMLGRGGGVIVDATCRSREDRRLLLNRLQATGVTLLIVRCEAPLELALTRAARRLGDPQRVSDATPQIAAEQFRSFEEFDEHSEGVVLGLDTAQGLAAQFADIARALDGRGLGRHRPSREGVAGPLDP